MAGDGVQAAGPCGERYREVLEAAAIGTWECDLSTGLLSFHPSYWSLHGLREPPPDARGMSVDAFCARWLHPDDGPAMRASAGAAVADGEGFRVHGPARLVQGDGSVRWAVAWIRVERDPEGRPVRVNAVTQDVTDRVVAEESLRRALAQQAALLDNIQDFAWVKTADGRYAAANRAFAEAFGLRVDDIAGKTDDDLWPLDVAARYRRDDEEVLATGERKHINELVVVHTGEARHFETLKSPIRDEAGCVVGTTGVARDVTDRQRAEEERIATERQLLDAQRRESLGALAGGVAHDFNNLLTAVLGNLVMVQLELAPEHRVQGLLEEARHAVARASDLTRQLLAYSGGGRFVVAALSLADLVRESLALLRSSIGRRVTVEVDIAPDVPPIRADRGQVQQVVFNLATNAAEAIGDGPGCVRLRVGMMTCSAADLAASRIEQKPLPGAFVVFEVADTGCGLPPEAERRLFEPFFSTKFAGRGLGLSAVLGIVRGHDGAILVDSTPGSGTTVRVLFPAAPGADVAVALGAGSCVWSRSESVGRRTILVVDDEPDVRTVCALMLRRLGYDTILAEDGLDGVARFVEHAERIACVLLDLTMPRMDGVAALREMKRHRPDVRVVLVSGFTEQYATEQVAGEDVAAFVAKPYDLEALRAALAGVLGGG